MSFRRLFHSTIKSGIQRQALEKAEEGIAVKACWSPKRPFCAAPGRVNERLQCCNSLARGFWTVVVKEWSEKTGDWTYNVAFFSHVSELGTTLDICFLQLRRRCAPAPSTLRGSAPGHLLEEASSKLYGQRAS